MKTDTQNLTVNSAESVTKSLPQSLVKKVIAKRKRENTILLILSIIDLILGIVSLVLSYASVQVLATLASLTTLAYSLKFFIERKYERKENIFMLIISIIDVLCGVLSVALVLYTVQIIASIASTLPFFKALKIFVQSEKGAKLLDTILPIFKSTAIKVAPTIGAFIISKIQKYKIEKGEYVDMGKFKNSMSNLATYIKCNTKTILSSIGNFLAAIGCGGLTAGGLVVGEVQIPLWATIIIGVVISILMFLFVEMGVVAEGIESKEEYDARKSKEQDEKDVAKALAEAKAKAKADAKQREKDIALMKAEKEKALKEMEAEKKAKEEAEKKAALEKELAEWQAKKALEEAKKAEAKAVAEEVVVEEVKAEEPIAQSIIR